MTAGVSPFSGWARSHGHVDGVDNAHLLVLLEADHDHRFHGPLGGAADVNGLSPGGDRTARACILDADDAPARRRVVIVLWRGTGFVDMLETTHAGGEPARASVTQAVAAREAAPGWPASVAIPRDAEQPGAQTGRGLPVVQAPQGPLHDILKQVFRLLGVAGQEARELPQARQLRLEFAVSRGR